MLLISGSARILAKDSSFALAYPSIPPCELVAT